MPLSERYWRWLQGPDEDVLDYTPEPLLVPDPPAEERVASWVLRTLEEMRTQWPTVAEEDDACPS
jgi:hypothetical protein